jgi:hypothetical protein
VRNERTNRNDEIRILRSVLASLDIPVEPSGYRFFGIAMAMIAGAQFLFAFGTFSGMQLRIAAAFFALGAISTYAVSRRMTADNGTMLAPHLDRESIKARLLELGVPIG